MLLGLGLGASIDEVIIVNDPYLCTLYECVILANLGVLNAMLKLSCLLCYIVVCALRINVDCGLKRVDDSIVC